MFINTVCFVDAQFSSRFQDPKTPEVYQMQKYGKQDITLYTGRPNINIPLFSIQYGQINLPFKMSYTSNGIRGDEEASRIGLGWYFDLPMINQTVQGYDDLEMQIVQPDYYNYYKPSFVISPQPEFYLLGCPSNPFLNLGVKPQRLNYSNSFKANAKDHLDGFFMAKIRGESNTNLTGGQVTYFPVNGSFYNFDLQNAKVTYGKNYDVEMDIFSMNLFGENIQFYKLPNQNSFFSLNKKNYSIELKQTGAFSTGSKKYEFIVKSPQGTRYVFAEQTNSSKVEIKNGYGMTGGVSYFADMRNRPTSYINDSIQLSPPDYSTQQVSEYTGPGDTMHSLSARTWKLVKVVDINNNEITFIYNRLNLVGKVFKNISGQCDFLKIETTGFNQMLHNTIQSDFEYFPQAPSLSQIELEKGEKIRCTKNIIETQNSQNTVLSDIIFGDSKIHFLNSSRDDIPNDVKIDEISISNKDNIVKKINFNYSYYPENHALSKRMKLDGVKINEEKYSFEYNQRNVSKFFDYWGYYNGITSQTPFINPFRLYQNDSNIPSWAIGLSNQIKDTENRSAHPENIKVGILEKIIYPTGGFTKFDYELNTFDNYFYPNYDNKVTFNKNNFEISHLNIDRNLSSRSTPSFSVTTGDVINGTITISNGISGTCSYSNSSFKIVKIPSNSYWIGKYSSGVGAREEFWNAVDNGSISTETVYSKTGFTSLGTINFTINVTSNSILAARVKYDSRCPTTGSPLGLIRSSFGSKEYKDYNQTFSSGFGLRVKETNDFTENNNLVLKRKYSYYGGKHIPPVTAVNDTDPYKMYYIHPTMNGNFYAFYLYSAMGSKISSSNNTFFQSNFLGNGDFVGYDRVEIQELGVNNQAKGLESYTFSNTPDERPKFGITDGVSQFEMDKFGYGIRKSNIIENGRLLKKEIFNSSNQLIKKDSLNYFNSILYAGDGNKSYNVRVIPKASSGYYIGCSSSVAGTITNFSNFSFYYYPLRGMETLLKTNFGTEVLNDGKLMTKIENTYNGYNLLNNKTTTTPSQDRTSEEITYSHELDKLRNQNIISENIGKIILKNGKHISKTIQKYENANHFNPTSIVTYDIMSNVPSTEVTYDRYDSKGNLEQYTTKSGTPVAIIWGYNQTQPIAKIEGATYAQVANQVAAIVNASNTDAANPDQEPALIAALDNLRRNLGSPAFQVTTYTYDPLIGVTSITPPSGIREVYMYDTANRLKEIRQDSKTGPVVKTFKYNYKQ